MNLDFFINQWLAAGAGDIVNVVLAAVLVFTIFDSLFEKFISL